MTRPCSLHVTAVPPPTGAHEIQRPRLIDFIDSGKATKLTLISAPAGYGTTTLMAQHCCASRKKGIGTAWLGFDERITEPGALMALLEYAIAISHNHTAEEQYNNVIFSAASARRSFNALLAQLKGAPPPFILYIDDIHFADTVETVRLLDDLLLALPEGVHILASTRTRPNLKIERLAGAGQLKEVTAQHLAFTEEEAATFLGDLVPRDQLKRFLSMTEGWPAGIQLCRFMHENGADPVAPPHIDLSHINGRLGHLADYLAEQVFRTLDNRTKEFLLQTSILDRFTGDIADAVSGHSDSWKIIDWLSSSNIFIFAADIEKRWFRYHRLFREFLLERLRREHRECEADLHRNAARVLAGHGHFKEALRHAIATHDLKFIEDLAVSAGGWRLTLVEGSSIWKPLQQYTGHSRDIHPSLRLATIYDLLHSGEVAVARQAHSDLVGRLTDSQMPRSAETEELIEIDCPIMDLFISAYEDSTWLPEKLSAFEQRLDAESERDPRVCAFAHELLAWGYFWRGDFRKAISTASISVRRCVAARTTFIETYAHLARGAALLEMADLDEAESCFKKARAVATLSLDTGSFQSIVASACQSEISLERGLLDVAWSEIQPIFERIDTSESWADLTFTSYKVGCWYDYRRRSFAHALLRIDEGIALFRDRPSVRLRSLLSILKIDLCLLGGSIEEAGAEAESLQLDRLAADPAASIGQGWSVSIPALAAAVRLAVERGDFASARSRLAMLRSWVRNIGARRHALTSEFLAALIASRSGDAPAAEASLVRALTIGRDTGQRLPFILDGGWTRPLIASIARSSQIDRRIQAVATEVLRLSDSNGESPSFGGVLGRFELSPREQQVFDLLCDGLTSKEIARLLSISVNTAMSYRKSVYKKLGAATRSDLVKTAKNTRLPTARRA